MRFQEPIPSPVSSNLFLLPVDQDMSSQLLLQCPACLPALIDSPSDVVSKPPIKCFFLSLALVMISLHSNRGVTPTLSKWGKGRGLPPMEFHVSIVAPLPPDSKGPDSYSLSASLMTSSPGQSKGDQSNLTSQTLGQQGAKSRVLGTHCPILQTQTNPVVHGTLILPDSQGRLLGLHSEQGLGGYWVGVSVLGHVSLTVDKY